MRLSSSCLLTTFWPWFQCQRNCALFLAQHQWAQGNALFTMEAEYFSGHACATPRCQFRSCLRVSHSGRRRHGGKAFKDENEAQNNMPTVHCCGFGFLLFLEEKKKKGKSNVSSIFPPEQTYFFLLSDMECQAFRGTNCPSLPASQPW